MSLAAIQDSLVKTSLVQHTQARSDDIGRGQESAMAAQVKEMERQEDQVVIHSREAEQNGIRDEEKKKDGKKKKQQDEDEQDKREDEDDEEETDNGPRARMRRINIVI